jgi:hypothetical protein
VFALTQTEVVTTKPGSCAKLTLLSQGIESLVLLLFSSKFPGTSSKRNKGSHSYDLDTLRIF